MKRSVYLETTIPSYYYETRKEAKSVAWREITREWWTKYKRCYNAVSSDVVIYELERKTHPMQKEKLEIMNTVERLPYVSAIDDIADEYIGHMLVPKEFVGDGYHLAYASYYGINFLLTWNCDHLANANKFQHIHIINTRLGISTPIICTPEQLLTKSEE
jgi:hypothetical protein